VIAAVALICGAAGSLLGAPQMGLAALKQQYWRPAAIPFGDEFAAKKRQHRTHINNTDRSDRLQPSWALFLRAMFVSSSALYRRILIF
jgi:hypothetical protein